MVSANRGQAQATGVLIAEVIEKLMVFSSSGK
jgi:hypothetical protein